jgi:hypothetical protein
MNCINNVRAVSQDLSQAGDCIRRSRKKISGASEVIQAGAIKIRSLHKKREKLESISETIRGLKALKDVHHAMVSSINTGEIGKAAEFAQSVLNCLKNYSYENFTALKRIGDSMQKNIYTIRQKADKVRRIKARTSLFHIT